MYIAAILQSLANNSFVNEEFSVYLDVDQSTDMRRLTTGICYEKCDVKRFRRCANVIECKYTNLHSTV